MIYTTHSHHLINPEWLNGAFIVRNKALNYEDELNYNANKTDVEAIPYKHFVALHPDQKDYYQPILDTLEYQPGLLEKIPFIIITEGKSDYYTLKYINRIYFNDKYGTLNFFPGGGADSNYPTIRLYLAWGRTFTIILDADKGGIKAKKYYSDTFGFEVKDNVHTYADVNSELKGLSTEDLFTAEDQLEITQSFDPRATKFEKGKFNTAIQNLLSKSEKVTLHEVTLKKFDVIFSFLLTKQNEAKVRV